MEINSVIRDNDCRVLKTYDDIKKNDKNIQKLFSSSNILSINSTCVRIT